MIKNYMLFAALFFSLNIAFCQVTTVLNGVQGASGLLINGNDLYIVEYNSTVVSKIDYTLATPTKSTLVSGLTTPSEIALRGNELFVSEFNIGRISKFDLSQTTPTRTTLITGLNRPSGLAINGDNLYIVDAVTNILYKIDVTATTPNLETVLTGLQRPIGLNIFGDDLYIAEDDGDRVSKIDLTAATPTRTTVATGINGAFDISFSPSGDYMYSIASDDGSITETDITSIPTSTSTTLQSGLDFPTRIQVIEEEVYASIFNENRLIKFPVETLGITKFIKENSVQISPNPSSDLLVINTTKIIDNYVIYDVLGKKVSEGKFNNSEKSVNISSLEKGLFLLKVDNYNFIKFIKK